MARSTRLVGALTGLLLGAFITAGTPTLARAQATVHYAKARGRNRVELSQSQLI